MEPATLTALLWGAAIGGSLLLGAAIAAWIDLPSVVGSGVAAFGGGILIAAVGFEIVPDADELAGRAATAAGLVAGALVFIGADWSLSREERSARARRGAQAAGAGRMDPADLEKGQSIALGAFVDGVPETAALGLTIAHGEIGAALLAGILVANFAESYGASAYMCAGGSGKARPVAIFGGIGAVLVAVLVLGQALLPSAPESATGFAVALAGGAVLATVSIAIIPNAFREVHRFAAFAIVLGFVAGFLLR